MSIEIDYLTQQKAYVIQIYSFSNPKNRIISFPAFITDFSDSYKSEWNPQRVLGKMDPISTFKNTTRTISLAFDVPSESIDESKQNLSNLDTIIRGLYPVYDQGALGTAVLASPPMFRVRFANFIRNASKDDDGDTLRTGLMCYLGGFDFKPKNDSGYFVDGDNLYPKLFSVNLNMNIIHEHPLGKTTDANGIKNRDGFSNFPRLDSGVGANTKNTSDAGSSPTTPAASNTHQAASSDAAQTNITG